MNRHRYLMEQVIEALRDGRDPFATDFLVEHSVTMNECYDIADTLAAGVEFMYGIAGLK